MRWKNTIDKYGTVSMLFHWVTAAAFIVAYVVVYYVIWMVDPDTSIKPPLFGVAPDGVSPDQRRAAKAINFGLMYGMSAFGLAARLDVDRPAAAQYIERYFERYPGVRRYMDETRRRAREQGYVETVEGRRLYLPEIRSRNRQQQQYAERAAINAPMQGTAADIIKRAMLAVDGWLEREAAGASLVMQVHDELVLEVDRAAVETVRVRLTELMCGAASLRVPLEVGIGVGSNWDEAH